MIDARILVEIRLKGDFGSILTAMGSSTPKQGLKCTYARATHQLGLSTPAIDRIIT
jgi:hypothetical protein